MNRIRVLIADDHALVRTGLRALLEAKPDIEVVGEAENGAVALVQARKLQPDVIIMDLTMPGRGGVATTEDLRRECPGARVVVLTMHDDEAYVRVAQLAGASAFVLKKALATDLIDAVRAAAAGKTLFPYGEPAGPTNTGNGPLELITGREREILGLIAHGHTSSEIAGALHISEKTVETHRAHIVEKLGLRTRAELVRFALDHGLLRP